MADTSTLQRVLNKRKKLQEAKNQIPWTILNFLGALLIYLDMKYRTEEKLIWFLEFIAFSYLTLNCVTGIILYFKRTTLDPPVPVSESERRIYSINETEPGFVTSTPVKQNAVVTPLPSPIVTTPVLSSNNVTQLSNGGNVTGNQSAADLSTTSNSWHFQKNRSLNRISNYTNTRGLDLEDEIVDDHSLSFLMKELEKETEKTSIKEDSFSSLRMTPSGYMTTDFSPMKKYAYQLSTLSHGTPSGKSATEESLLAEGTTSSNRTQDIWRQFGVDNDELLYFSENIRMWLTATILKPLVSEIDQINDSLTAHGLSDSRIGEVSLEKLRKTSQIIPVAANIPSLTAVLPYLEVTPHQDYLVHRLNELAAGGCMSEFRWDGGSAFKSKNWDESLPTDTLIVLHCLSTYLDSQLPALTDRPDKGPFSGHYIVRQTEKPHTASVPLIVELQLNPPHYKLVFGEQEYQFPKGRNNLLHTLLLFFYILKARFDGHMGRINLGPSGLNILWVLDS